MTQHQAVATSLVAIVPTGLSAAIWHMRAGSVNVRIGSFIGISCAASMYVAAAHLAPLVPENHLRRLYAGLMAISAVRMCCGRTGVLLCPIFIYLFIYLFFFFLDYIFFFFFFLNKFENSKTEDGRRERDESIALRRHGKSGDSGKRKKQRKRKRKR